MDRSSLEYRAILTRTKEHAERLCATNGEDPLDLIRDLAFSLMLRLDSATMNHMASVFSYMNHAKGQSTQKAGIGYSSLSTEIAERDMERHELQGKLQLALDLIRMICDQRIAELVTTDPSCDKA